MKGTLIIFILTVASSYKTNTEYEAVEHFDVLEWWVVDDAAYRIKTYVVDQDIHINKLAHSDPESIIDLSYGNTRKHYGDIIKSEYRLDFDGTETLKDIEKKLSDVGLNGTIDFDEFLFWNPDGLEYRTITTPK